MRHAILLAVAAALMLAPSACNSAADGRNESAPAAKKQRKKKKRTLGIVGKQAPHWGVKTWFNLPAGKRIDVADFRGKVVYLYFFQSWCPGCHKHGFPTLKEVSKHYAGNQDVVFVTVQTTFEGFETNDAAAAKKTGDQFGLTIPVGHDAGRNRSGSYLMRRYRSGGTPWTIIIDRKGIVRFNAFGIRSGGARSLIDRLLAQR